MRSSVLVLLVATVAVGAEAPMLVTSPAAQSASASGDSFVPSLSRNGRFVCFLSNARNIVTSDDYSACLRVFRHDLETGEILSVPANRDTTSFSVSADGRFIAFASMADNVVGDDRNAASDIFLWDVDGGSTALVSFALTGRSPPDPFPYRNRTLSDHPLISPDGTWVAFESYATNLVSKGDTNAETDVFLCHIPTRRTVAVSVDATGQRAGNRRSTVAAMTPDGRHVLFVSRATDLTPDDLPGGVERVFVRDMTTATTICVERTRSFSPVISTNGQFVAFKTAATNATNAAVLLKDVRSGELRVLAQNSRLDSSPQISEDGRYVAYEDGNVVYVWDRETEQQRAVSASGTNRAFKPLLSATGWHVAFLEESAPRVFQIFLRDLNQTNAVLISATPSGLASRDNHELNRFTMDAAGRSVAFDSSDHLLAPDDLNHTIDVFLRSAEDPRTRLISRAATRPSTSGASMVSRYGISHDGSVLVFRSDASDLVLQDTNRARDVFVKDFRTGAVTSLTTGRAGERAGEGEPVISADGNFALYAAFKAPPSPWSFGVGHTLVRRDLRTGEDLQIAGLRGVIFTDDVQPLSYSINSNGTLAAARSSPFNLPYGHRLYLLDLSAGTNRPVDIGFDASVAHWPLISPDSTAVIFATGLTPSAWHLRDLVQQRTILIGKDPETRWASLWAPRTSFSANSRYVVWGTRQREVSVFDRRYETNTLVCTNCANPSISADGSWVAYETFETGTGIRNIELQHLPTRQATLISRNVFGTGGGNRSSSAPVISADARFIAYVSRANDLIVDDQNTWTDLFVHDRLQGTTIAINGSGPASSPRLSGDGRTVIFQSFAADLVAGDYNRSQDVFVMKLAGGDSDNDALPDDWEAAYFGDLARDGAGDFDEDGHSDLQEYVAGTDPTNVGSIVRVITLTASSTGQRRVFWSAVPGKVYRVEYKANLTEGDWTALPMLVTAEGPTASLADSTAGFGDARFYRVVTIN